MGGWLQWAAMARAVGLHEGSRAGLGADEGFWVNVISLISWSNKRDHICLGLPLSLDHYDYNQHPQQRLKATTLAPLPRPAASDYPPSQALANGSSQHK